MVSTRTPDVSIIVTNVNGFRGLTSTVRSLLEQTHSNIEVLLLDAHPADRADRGAVGLVHRDPRVMVIPADTDRATVSDWRAIGLRHVRAPFVMFMSQGEMAERDECRRLLRAARRTGSDLAFRNQPRRPRWRLSPEREHVSAKHWNSNTLYQVRDLLEHAEMRGVLYHLAFLEQNKAKEGYPIEDILISVEPYRAEILVARSATVPGPAASPIIAARAPNDHTDTTGTQPEPSTVRTSPRIRPVSLAREYYLLGRTRERMRDWAGAVDAYGNALDRRDEPAHWHFRLGLSKERLGDWQGAQAAYEAALDRNDRPARWHYRLGRTKERLKDWPGAEVAYRTALALDGSVTPLDHKIADTTTRRLLQRRRIGDYLARNLDEIRMLALTTEKVVEDKSDKIFVYWAQGFQNAPPVVQLCHQELLRNSGDSVVSLDDETLKDYATLPPDIDRALGCNRTKRSDLLRLELLSRYGGVWLDATCLTVGDVRVPLGDLLQSGFFAFRRRELPMASWLLASTPNHYIVALLREAQYHYWRTFGRAISYYVLHHILEMLDYLDDAFGHMWEETPRVSADPALRLARRMTQPYSEQRLHALLSASFVHKLTYKYDPTGLRDDSLLVHLLRHGPS